MKALLIVALGISSSFAATVWTSQAKSVTLIESAECASNQSITCLNLEGESVSQGTPANFCFYASSPMANIFLSKAEVAMTAGMKLRLYYDNSFSMPNCAVGTTYKIIEMQLGN